MQGQIALASNTFTNRMQVQGEAMVQVIPDEIVLQLGVVNENKTVQPAKAANDNTIAALINYCKTIGMESKFIQTDFMEIRPIYKDLQLIKYRVEQGIAITLRDIDQYESLLAKALELGCNRVHNIQFRTTKFRELKDKARRMAIQAAKEKASLLCEETGIICGKIVNVSEQVHHYYPFAYRNAYNQQYANAVQNVAQYSINGYEADSGSSFSAGKIGIRSTINLVYSVQE